jgi:hypothetical protein
LHPPLWTVIPLSTVYIQGGRHERREQKRKKQLGNAAADNLAGVLFVLDDL